MDHPVHLGGEAFVLTELKVTPPVEKKQPGRCAVYVALSGQSCCMLLAAACVHVQAAMLVAARFPEMPKLLLDRGKRWTDGARFQVHFVLPASYMCS